MIDQDITAEEYIIRELSKYCGETGVNEDACQTLNRIINHKQQLKSQIKVLRDWFNRVDCICGDCLCWKNITNKLNEIFGEE